ncbi:CPBP family intramembrane glutamic endopeptidase [Methylomicrobium sp. RS1]|jgi:membrane protease YdiL (CAAX protease family)|uniref:CPBP family intramembrane glutamic endopeptidase n=1 Tax=Candidatus Methylomicrobium oryzae TaxID=2802053 RepID=UPI0019217E74|nr:CPBP family intramembrane glutamic endopeptidase [Methylomicrobium sp. RS1]MBL1263249.1 CPBP family intramembrane metalloprotease [Methylomicrobium sp. RS1]
MNQSAFKSRDFFLKACCFEASLILVALILGWIADINPFAKLFLSEAAILYGIIGTAPMIVLFHLAELRQEEAFQKIRRLLLETLGPSLHRRHWADLLMLAAIAGLSEEILFRGLIQPWLEAVLGMRAGLVGCNVLFGLAHAVTPLYTLLAFLIGIYLSLSMDYGAERNLLTPVVIHALYDFWAFLALIKAYQLNQTRQKSGDKP